MGTAPRAELEYCLRIAGTFYFGSSARAQDRQLAFSSFIEFSINVSREMIQSWGDALICSKQVPNGSLTDIGPFDCLLMVSGPCSVLAAGTALEQQTLTWALSLPDLGGSTRLLES